MNTAIHNSTAIYSTDTLEWAAKLYALVDKNTTLQSSLMQQAAQAASNGCLTTLCPISGVVSTMQCNGLQSVRLPKAPLLQLHPLLTAQLPTTTEASLPLHMLLSRILFTLAMQGIVSISTLLPMQAVCNSPAKHRLVKALPKLQALIGIDKHKLDRLPILRLSSTLLSTGDESVANAISVWALRCYGLTYVDYSLSVSDSDSEALAELDAMLNIDERLRLLQQKKEEAAQRAARAAATKRISKLTLSAACTTVCAVMAATHNGWHDAVHAPILKNLCRSKPTVDAAWYSLISNLLIDSYPDRSILGNERYEAYMLVQQHLDMLQLQHSQALAELDCLPQDTAEQTRSILAKYNALHASSKLDAKMAAKANVSTAATTTSAQRTVKALQAAVIDAAIAVNGNDKATAAITSNTQLTIAQRIAALKAAKANS